MLEKSFHILTFGCQMNVHDSQWLARALTGRGFREAPLAEAQVVVINTCSVREKTGAKSHERPGPRASGHGRQS